MSANDKDKDKNIVNFDALDAEGGDDDETPNAEQKLREVLTGLKGKMETEDYGDLMEALGIKDEMSNTELFTAIKALIKGKDDDEGDDDDEKKKPGDDGDDDEKDAGDYKDFMKKCMEGGEDLKACQEKYKEKYPEPAPKDEEIAEVEELAKQMIEAAEKMDPKDKLLKEMETRLKKLENEKELGAVSAKVDELIKDKHLAPIQRDQIIKLASKLPDEDQGALLEFFRTTMKLSAHQDAGILGSDRPGAAGGVVLSPERKQELIKLHGLEGLIQDKANLDRLPWKANN